jgi:hypothetical protein
LRDLPGERVAVEGIVRQRMHAKNELAAPGSAIGHRDRGLHALDAVMGRRLKSSQVGGCPSE